MRSGKKPTWINMNEEEICKKKRKKKIDYMQQGRRLKIQPQGT